GVFGFERRLQLGKVRDAGFLLHDDLAVNQGGVRRKLGDGRRHIGKLVDPVEALAGEETHVAAVEAGLDAVAGELNLVQPTRAPRRGRTQGGERGRNEIRQGRVWPAVLVAGFLLRLLRRACSSSGTTRGRLRTFARARTTWGGGAGRTGLDVLLHAA